MTSISKTHTKTVSSAWIVFIVVLFTAFIGYDAGSHIAEHMIEIDYN